MFENIYFFWRYFSFFNIVLKFINWIFINVVINNINALLKLEKQKSDKVFVV